MTPDDRTSGSTRSLLLLNAVDAATIIRALREASVTMLAAVVTLVCALWIDPGPGPAVLAVVLCLALSRSHLDRDRRGRIEAAIALPIVGLVAVGVGLLLHRAPWLGALVFVAGLFLSVWLRRFGPMAQRAGSLIALPFVVLLATPYIPPTSASRVPAALTPVVIALLALLSVSVFHALALRVRFLSHTSEPRRPMLAPKSGSSMRPIASTRMAIQMAVALALSFAVGYVYFAERWAWIVLTTFIVLGGNRGRLDVAYKSVLRVVGAAAGTVIGQSLSAHVGSHDSTTVLLILAAIFLGVWLRPLNYTWWALCITLALALLQGFTGSSPSTLWPRLEEIVIGAIFGVTTAWFILPVRSTAALRRRIADALATLSDALDPATSVRTPHDFLAAIDRVEQMAPAFRVSRLLTRRFRAMHPADWVDTLIACRDPAIAVIEKRKPSGAVRRAVGTARKSMREPSDILPALQGLHGSLVD